MSAPTPPPVRIYGDRIIIDIGPAPGDVRDMNSAVVAAMAAKARAAFTDFPAAARLYRLTHGITDTEKKRADHMVAKRQAEAHLVAVTEEGDTEAMVAASSAITSLDAHIEACGKLLEMCRPPCEQARAKLTPIAEAAARREARVQKEAAYAAHDKLCAEVIDALNPFLSPIRASLARIVALEQATGSAIHEAAARRALADLIAEPVAPKSDSTLEWTNTGAADAPAEADAAQPDETPEYSATAY